MHYFYLASSSVLEKLDWVVLSVYFFARFVIASSMYDGGIHDTDLI